MIEQSKKKLLILRDYYSEKGFFKLCLFIGNNILSFQKLLVFEIDLSFPVNMEASKMEIVIRLLSEKDIDRLVEFWPDIYAPPVKKHLAIKEMIIERISMGEKCMIAEYNGRIIHMNWIGFKNTHLFNDYVLNRGIKSDEAIGYNIYTVPEYRGNGIVTAVWGEICNYLFSKNYKKLIHYVVSHNIASIKVTSKFFNRKAILYNIRILTFPIYFLDKRVK